jgi:hypothetical protein
MKDGNMYIIGQFVGSNDGFFDLLIDPLKYKHKGTSKKSGEMTSSRVNEIDIIITCLWICIC